MKSSLLLCALVLATTLIFAGGCSDPASIADNSSDSSTKNDRVVAPAKDSSESSRPSPAVDHEPVANETPAVTPSSNSESRTSTNSSREAWETPTATRELASSAPTGIALPDAPTSTPAEASVAKSKSAKAPKKEFIFEFVSSTGNEGLEPGDTVPEITGKDLDNIKFNLSDYEGKVIMLDFWGDW